MTAALALRDIRKDYRGLRPLRLNDLALAPGERVALAGLDAPAAEVLVNLVTGAGVPDEGVVEVFGEPTTAITDGDAWLASLDRFGIVSHRSVLLDAATVGQNIAMVFTLAIDPVPDDVAAKVRAVAGEARIAEADLDRGLAGAPASLVMRTHLARALAPGPRLLVLEHPTAALADEDVAAFAEVVRQAADARGLAVLAITNDDGFASALGGRAVQLEAGTGRLKSAAPGWKIWKR